MSDQVTLNEMYAAALKIGRADWGSTGELSVEEHKAHLVASIENTAKSFEQTGPQAMHGVYIEGTNTVICHTGTSPNSPNHARIMAALWNRFVEEARVASGEYALAAEKPDDT